jgi:phosphohistidine swiveling domain-containing protein
MIPADCLKKGKTIMSTQVRFFKDLGKDGQEMAGGKGGTLARLYQAGFPVPDGFVILPPAFSGDEITSGGWEQVQAHLNQARHANGSTPFAVRSSALSEDSSQASFGGQFETVLNVHTNEAIREAINTVRRSRHNERVQAYSQAKQMESDHEIAVVVQTLVQADISGILFTADPVTGSHLQMSGNFIHGLGEELVSGEVEPFTFTLSRPGGKYNGPPELKRFARRLFKLALRLEKKLEAPQDIEWSIAKNKLYLLQSRPITTLIGHDPATGLWNSSQTGDYLWIGHEVFPDVMTPSTWSVFMDYMQADIAGMRAIGNIGGRFYMNVSFTKALMNAFGRSNADLMEHLAMAAVAVPEGVRIPDIPLSRWALIKAMLPVMWRLLPLQRRLKRDFAQIISDNPATCADLRQRIRQADNGAALITLWREEAHPLFLNLVQLQDALNEDYFNPFLATKKTLTQLVGDDEAQAMLATLSGGSGLASMGPIVGLSRLAKGEISRDEYAQLAGHRPAKENELAEKRPDEDEGWIDRQLAEFEQSPVDVEAMMARRTAEFDALWNDFSIHYPKEAQKLGKKLEQIRHAVERRELIRSELTRSLGVLRSWYLRAGELTGLGDGIFFLAYEEALDVLAGDDDVASTIPARREMHERLCALPPYPMIINGRFDPFQWAADPNRRGDIFDAKAPLPVAESDVIKGYPGSAGRVEGSVRFLTSPDEGHELQEGEILLAMTTNVGWTPIFPRAAAVITDVGAPLSHAAIIARELGIPAVVGCGDATRRLRTGDRVLVDGGRGTVEILPQHSGPQG